jgi:hypothetical protein
MILRRSQLGDPLYFVDVLCISNLKKLYLFSLCITSSRVVLRLLCLMIH